MIYNWFDFKDLLKIAGSLSSIERMSIINDNKVLNQRKTLTLECKDRTLNSEELLISKRALNYGCLVANNIRIKIN